MNLKFEIELNRRDENLIIYDVMRKGIKIGILVMEQPYNRDEALLQEMEMK